MIETDWVLIIYDMTVKFGNFYVAAIYINSSVIDGNGLSGGDEIAVMENGLCIGAIRPYDLEETPYQLFVP